MTVILGPRPMSRREELTCQRLRNAVQLWTTVYTEMGWCDDMRDKLRLHMLLHATCSHREVEPRFIRVWLQGPVLQDAAAANRRRCVRNALTNVAEQEHEDGNHARMSVLYARAMLAYHYTLAAIGKHMHNLQDGEQCTDSDLDEAGEILVRPLVLWWAPRASPWRQHWWLVRGGSFAATRRQKMLHNNNRDSCKSTTCGKLSCARKHAATPQRI